MTTEEAAPPPARRVFVRRLEIPPGAPWDQTRAARLESVHAAPLGGDEVLTVVRRLEPWRSGAPGRFAAAYARRDELDGGFVHAVILEGRNQRFVFNDPASAVSLRRRVLIVGALAALASLVTALGVGKASEHRDAAEAHLARLEANARRHERVARREADALNKARLLVDSGAAGRSFADVASDLAWLGQARAPGAAVRDLVWTPETMSLKVASEDPPVLGLERAVEQVGEGPGETEWRISRARPAAPRAGAGRPSVVNGPPSRPSVVEPG